MVQITLISVGTLKENYLKEAVSEYKKRLTQYAKIEEISIKEEPIKVKARARFWGGFFGRAEKFMKRC